MNTKRSFLSIIFLLIIIASNLEVCRSTWNFSSVNLPDDVTIWRFAIWKNRAFLAIPSFSKIGCDEESCKNVTLLEAVWPEPGNSYSVAVAESVNSGIRVFHKISENISNECEKLLSVTGLDVDARGRLWILDSPSVNGGCPAKIVIYDLRRNDHELTRTDLLGVAKIDLKSLAIDPVIGTSGPRAYVGDPGDESIIIYSLIKKRWWKHRLVHALIVPRVYTTELAISRRDSQLYFTGPQSQNLFSIDLNEIRRSSEPPSAKFINVDEERNSTVKWHGTKMGRSSGMVCDHKGGLHYFLVTEHASVRWDTKHDLKASSYSIVLQSEQVPCITDYRVDLHRNVWGLVNLEHPFATTSSTKFVSEWKAKFRTIQIF